MSGEWKKFPESNENYRYYSKVIMPRDYTDDLEDAVGFSNNKYWAQISFVDDDNGEDSVVSFSSVEEIEDWQNRLLDLKIQLMRVQAGEI